MLSYENLDKSKAIPVTSGIPADILRGNLNPGYCGDWEAKLFLRLLEVLN